MTAISGQAPGSASHAALETRLMRAIAILTLAYAAMLVMISPASFYTMDDPYIHLAVAENIVRGTYGINLGEASNPSSSIIWPWLLTPFAKMGVVAWGPLVINVICFLLTARMLAGFAVRQLAPAGADPTNALIFAGLGFFSFNLFGVMFTGLEHSLHTLACVMAMSRAVEKRYDAVMLAGLVLAPLVRFEGFALLALGLAAAISDRRYVFAALALGIVVACVAVWEMWLSAAGLPPLPSSVLAKSGVSSQMVEGGSHALRSLSMTVWDNLQLQSFHMFGLFGAVAAWVAITRQGRDRLIALGMIGFGFVVLIFSRIGIYSRYDVHVLVTLGVMALYLMREPLMQLLSSRRIAVALGGGLMLLNFAQGPTIALTTPLAVMNIERQQHQMHVFASQCWKRPIAINDLGWVALQNDNYVLDLVGLGSESARIARASGQRDWMNRQMDAHGVELAAVYKSWFPELPANWIVVGELVLTDPRITPSGDVVTVYATRQSAVAPAKQCLEWLAIQAPSGTLVRVAS